MFDFTVAAVLLPLGAWLALARASQPDSQRSRLPRAVLVIIAAVVAVGVLMGVVFLGGWLDELVIASVRARWRWAHVLLSIVFLFALFRGFSEITLAFELRAAQHN